MLLDELGAKAYTIKGRSGMLRLNLEPDKRHPAGLREVFEQSGGDLLGGLARSGAVLIRGANLKSVEDFESIWNQPFRPWDGYMLMEKTRKKMGRVAVSSNYRTGEGGALSFHQENHFLPMSLSPDWLAFFCLQPAELGGETALINVADAFESLSPSLQRKLREHATTHSYRLNAEHWKAQFGGTFTPEAVEQQAHRYDVKISDLRQSSVRMSYRRPYVSEHRISGLPAVHFERKLIRASRRAMMSYLAVFRPHHIEALAWVFQPQDRRARASSWLTSKWRMLRTSSLKLHEYLLRGNYVSTLALTGAETEELCNAWASHVMAVPYQTGDILLIDNMITEHTALAWKGDRRISVILGNYSV